MTDTEKETIKRLEGAQKFIQTSARISSEFKNVWIYQHPPCNDNTFIFHVRAERKGAKGKAEKQSSWISFDGEKYFNEYRHLEFFKKGGKYKPFAGVSLKNPSPPPIKAGDTVFICEGHKLVAYLIWLGLKAITSGGATSYNACEWGSLPAKLNLIIWPDNDKQGINYALNVAKICRGLGHACKFIDYQSLNLPDKGDVLDWYAINPKATSKDILALPVLDDIETEAGGIGPDEWEKPEPLNNQTLPAMSLPFEALPDSIVPWIKDEANRMPAPPDWITVAIIILASALIGTRCAIRPSQYNDWLCVPNLWGGAVGAPSTMKSPCLSKGIAPLDALEKEAFENYENDFKDYSKLKHKYDIKKKGIEGAIKKEWIKKNRNLDVIKELENELETLFNSTPLPPVCKRYRAEDINTEKAGIVLAENPAGLLIFCDELSALFSRWNKTGREGERGFYLKAFEGKQPDISDRVGRGTTWAERVCLAICGGIQPDILQFYFNESIHGLNNDGLLQRFQLLVWPDDIPPYKLIKDYPDMKARERAYKVIQKIASLDFERLGAQKQGNDFFLCFDSKAQPVYDEWIENLEGDLRGKYSNFNSILIEHFGKFRSLMPSLALIFEMIDTADLLCRGAEVKSLAITKVNASKACDFVDEYLTSHALKIYGYSLNSGQRAVDMLASKIKEGKIKDGFTVNEIQLKNWKGLMTSADIKKACQILTELNWLKMIDGRSGGFAPSGKISYLINPEINKAS